MSMGFNKEEFKKSVLYNVKNLFRRTMDEATPAQVFQAVSYAVKDVIIDEWIASQKTYAKEDAKTVYYLSMEFLMGRALGNNIINIMAQDEIREVLDELGFDLNLIEDQEPDPALGNGGLGRLAACFLDSLATLGYPAYGCGIRYHYGMFKQKIENGFQMEVPDEWLKDGNPFEVRRSEYATEVKFGGYVRVERTENGHERFVQEGYQSVMAVPYDLPIVGYGNNVVNTLRIWDAQPVNTFSLAAFDKGNYQQAVEQENLGVVAWPKIEIQDVGKEGLTFKATVTTRPTATLGEYKGLSAPKNAAEVTAEDIENELKPFISRATRMVTVEREAQNGDTVVITAGVPLGKTGYTNLIKAQIIDEEDM